MEDGSEKVEKKNRNCLTTDKEKHFKWKLIKESLLIWVNARTQKSEVVDTFSIMGGELRTK